MKTFGLQSLNYIGSSELFKNYMYAITILVFNLPKKISVLFRIGGSS